MLYEIDSGLSFEASSVDVFVGENSALAVRGGKVRGKANGSSIYY